MIANRVSILFLSMILTTTLLAQTPPKEGTATVSGIVTQKGAPARGAMVALQPPGGEVRFELKNVLRVKTDDTGRFRFEKIKAGRYYLGAITPGYVAPGETRYGPQGKAIHIAEGENADGIEIALQFGVVVTGRVADSQGNPVVGEGVSLSRLNAQGKPENLFLGQNGGMYATDDRGIYRLYGLPAGRYTVSVGFAQAPNSITMTSRRVFYPKTYHPDVTAEAQAKIVEVAEGAEATGVDITIGGLKKNYDVAGRVIYAETGKPIADIEVHYGSFDREGKRIGAWGSFNVKTNEQGEFRFPNVLPGKYGMFAGTWSIRATSDAYSEPAPFEVTDSDVSDVEIKLKRGGSISGVAVIEGVGDQAILAKLSQLQLWVSVTSQEPVAPNQGNTAKIAAGGGFRFSGVQAGKARIAISQDSMSPSSPSRSFSVLRIERSGALQNDGIEVSAGEQITGVRVVLGYGTGVLLGQVKIIGGQLPDTVRLSVRAQRLDSSVAVGSGGQPDPHGQFRIENIPPGEYELTLRSYLTSNDEPLGYAELVEKLKTAKRRVTIGSEAETPATITLDLSRKEGNQ
ncbi:MAG: carboxypeptidase-like regulatory domain-containing protein [Acidobacteriota bacterium]|nr:carboxypeptidase-like regulatory domain-containing protein [Acidobacteriota bacterium]